MKVIDIFHTGTALEVNQLVSGLLDLRDVAWSEVLAKQGEPLRLLVSHDRTIIIAEWLQAKMSDGRTVLETFRSLPRIDIATVIRGVLSKRDQSWKTFLKDLEVSYEKVPSNPIEVLLRWLDSDIEGEVQCKTDTTDITQETQRSKREGQLGG